MPREIEETSTALTDGVQIAVSARYLADRSFLPAQRYVFAYTVRIHNAGRWAVQLLSRHWVIADCSGNLEHWLLRRPRETVLDEAWPWAIWYPLRRSGAFERLEPRERESVLREHGEIGRAYGAAGIARDVRLACHGLDSADNEFIIGLVGEELHPLSHLVQTMRTTRQTSEFVAQMGPFFVGRATFRNAG